MATYPTFPQIIGSQLELLDDLQVDEAQDGSARARAFFPAVKYRLRLIHVLDNADLATLLTFYSDHRLDASVTIQWKPECGGASYECVFEGAPRIDYNNPFSQVHVIARQV